MSDKMQADWSKVGEGAATAALDIIQKRAPDIVRRAADDLYEQVLMAAQDYFVSNATFNIQESIDAAHRTAEHYRVRAEKADALCDDLITALAKCRTELAVVRDGSTGGVPNSVVALIPEAIEAADAALSKAAEKLTGKKSTGSEAA